MIFFFPIEIQNLHNSVNDADNWLLIILDTFLQFISFFQPTYGLIQSFSNICSHWMLQMNIWLGNSAFRAFSEVHIKKVPGKMHKQFLEHKSSSE